MGKIPISQQQAIAYLMEMSVTRNAKGVLNRVQRTAKLAFLIAVLSGGWQPFASPAAVLPPQSSYLLAPGRLINVGGFKLNLYCFGSGSPTVVMEHGLGSSAYAFGLVQKPIAKFTRACSYDRAGYGFSQPGPLPRTSGRIVSELHELLERAGEKPPYVLVGFSFGGMLVKQFAEEHRTETAGMVLIDPSHEDMMKYYPAAWREYEPKTLNLLASCRDDAGRANFHSGDVAYEKCVPFVANKKLPEPLRSHVLVPLSLRPDNYATQLSELEGSDGESSREIRSLRCSFGAMPLEILHATGSSSSRADADSRAFDVGYESLLQSTAELSSVGEFLLVSQAGHAIAFDRPQVVVDAVRHVVDDARLPLRSIPSVRTDVRPCHQNK